MPFKKETKQNLVSIKPIQLITCYRKKKMGTANYLFTQPIHYIEDVVHGQFLYGVNLVEFKVFLVLAQLL